MEIPLRKSWESIIFAPCYWWSVKKKEIILELIVERPETLRLGTELLGVALYKGPHRRFCRNRVIA